MGVSLKGLESSGLDRPRMHGSDDEVLHGTNILSLRLYFIVTDITRLMSDGYGWVDFSVESSTKIIIWERKKVVHSIM